MIVEADAMIARSLRALFKSSGYEVCELLATGRDRGKQYGVIRTLELKDIDPSPHQRRKIFNVDKLKELTSSMQREGQIAAILVRRIGADVTN